MLGKELAFDTCILFFFGIGVEKVMLEHLKVLQVRVMVKLDWNSFLKIHLKIVNVPSEVYSKVWWGRRV